MKLHPVTGSGNRFCGPAVISAITGIENGEAAARLAKWAGKRCVMSTSAAQVTGVLYEMGYLSAPMPSTYLKPDGLSSKVTLAAWLKLSKAIRTAGRVYLISAGRHWQLVSGRRYVCGRTREIVSVRDPRVKRRARVRAVWEIKPRMVYNSLGEAVERWKSAA